MENMQIVVHLNVKPSARRRKIPVSSRSSRLAPKKDQANAAITAISSSKSTMKEAATINFMPKDRESYQNLFQLAEHVRNVIVQGIDDIEPCRREEGERRVYTLY